MAYKILDHADDHICSENPENEEEYDTDKGSEGSDGGVDQDELGPGTDIDERRRFYTASEALMYEIPRVEPQEDLNR